MTLHALTSRLPQEDGQIAWSRIHVGMTGATGFLGLHLCKLLRERGAQVTALVRASSNTSHLEPLGVRSVIASMDDRDSLASALRGCQLLFHMAGAVDFAGDWDRFRQINVVGTENVLAAAQTAGITRAVHTSSIVAVGAQKYSHQRASEDSAWNLGELRVPYVTTKREAEEAALACNSPMMEVVVVNPASVIGPLDYSRSEFGTMCYRFWKGRLPVYFRGGNNFVDVRDVALGHVLAAERGQAGERYLLTGYNLTYGEFFRELAKHSPRFLPRLPLPHLLAYAVAWLNEKFPPKNGARLYLSLGQARLVARFFYFESQKSAQALGYRCRPLAETLAETHAFWMPKERTARLPAVPGS